MLPRCDGDDWVTDADIRAHIARMFDGHAEERAARRAEVTIVNDGIVPEGRPTCDEADLIELIEMENQLRDVLDYDGDRMLMSDYVRGIVDELRVRMKGVPTQANVVMTSGATGGHLRK